MNNLPANTIVRDMRGKVGGPVGVASAQCIYTATGKLETTLEWGVWSLLDNYSDAGQNVAVYGQSNSRGKGPTWGACFECCDMGEVGATQLGAEITMNMFGKDTNENRMGLDITVNDSRLWRGRGAQTGPVEATVGVRVNADGQFSWRDCFQGWGFRRAGMALRSLIASAVGLRLEGPMATLIDAQGAQYPVVAKISSGSGAFTTAPQGARIGSLKVLIDGTEYLIPIHVKG